MLNFPDAMSALLYGGRRVRRDGWKNIEHLEVHNPVTEPEMLGDDQDWAIIQREATIAIKPSKAVAEAWIKSRQGELKERWSRFRTYEKKSKDGTVTDSDVAVKPEYPPDQYNDLTIQPVPKMMHRRIGATFPIALQVKPRTFAPWIPTAADMLATDWRTC